MISINIHNGVAALLAHVAVLSTDGVAVAPVHYTMISINIHNGVAALLTHVAVLVADGVAVAPRLSQYRRYFLF